MNHVLIVEAANEFKILSVSSIDILFKQDIGNNTLKFYSWTSNLTYRNIKSLLFQINKQFNLCNLLFYYNANTIAIMLS